MWFQRLAEITNMIMEKNENRNKAMNIFTTITISIMLLGLFLVFCSLVVVALTPDGKITTFSNLLMFFGLMVVSISLFAASVHTIVNLVKYGDKYDASMGALKKEVDSVILGEIEEDSIEWSLETYDPPQNEWWKKLPTGTIFYDEIGSLWQVYEMEGKKKKIPYTK
jgi:hypothetical protein